MDRVPVSSLLDLGVDLARNGKVESRSRTIIQRCPQATMMSLDNGAADRQPDSHSVLFCRVRRFKEFVGSSGLETHACILHGQAYLVPVDVFGRDDQVFCWTFDTRHRVRSIS